MKKLIRKFTHACAAAVIACFAIYGMVYAQQVCCTDIANECIPVLSHISANNSFSNACIPSPMHRFRSETSTNHCKNDLNDAETCCKNNSCDTYGQTVYISPSSTYDVTVLQNEVSSIDTCINTPFFHKASTLPISPISEPIYILTQSILC